MAVLLLAAAALRFAAPPTATSPTRHTGWAPGPVGAAVVADSSRRAAAAAGQSLPGTRIHVYTSSYLGYAIAVPLNWSWHGTDFSPAAGAWWGPVLASPASGDYVTLAPRFHPLQPHERLDQARVRLSGEASDGYIPVSQRTQHLAGRDLLVVLLAPRAGATPSREVMYQAGTLGSRPYLAALVITWAGARGQEVATAEDSAATLVFPRSGP